MADITRFGVSIEDTLLASFDQLIDERGYTNRSEALRDLIRDALVQSHVDAKNQSREVIGSLTLIYDHHSRDLADRLAERQHEHPEVIVSVMHVHLSHDDCMEVIVLRGKARVVRALADSLLNLKGVKHGRLFLTVPAQTIAQGHRARSHAHSHA